MMHISCDNELAYSVLVDLPIVVEVPFNLDFTTFSTLSFLPGMTECVM